MENISGIYKITNKINGKFYIGSSQNISQRWYDHKRELRNNRHCNKHLQDAWNKYGEDSFCFEVIEECDICKLSEIEQKYIDEYIDSGRMYNISRDTVSSMRGRKHTEEAKKKMSETRKGINSGEKHWLYGKHVSDETKKKLSEAFSGENNPMYGKHHSEETLKKLSNSHKGNKCPEYLKQRFRLEMLGSGNPFYGKHHTKESIELMSKNRTGLLKGADSPVRRKIVRISENTGETKIYETVTDAANDNNAQRSHIALVCRGERKHAGGYKWMYYEDYQYANTEVSNQIAKG